MREGFGDGKGVGEVMMCEVYMVIYCEVRVVLTEGLGTQRRGSGLR